MKHLSLITTLLLFAFSAGAQSGVKKDTANNAPTVAWLKPAENIKNIRPADATANVGQNVLVVDKVWGHAGAGKGILLYFGAAYPNQQLTVEVKPQAMDNINLETIDGYVVNVDGVITPVDNQPRIVVSERSHFGLVGKARKH